MTETNYLPFQITTRNTVNCNNTDNLQRTFHRKDCQKRRPWFNKLVLELPGYFISKTFLSVKRNETYLSLKCF